MVVCGVLGMAVCGVCGAAVCVCGGLLAVPAAATVAAKGACGEGGVAKGEVHSSSGGRGAGG